MTTVAPPPPLQHRDAQDAFAPCPQCSYDLRGLRPDQTACPECGADISEAAAKLRAARAAQMLRRVRWLFAVSPLTVLVPAGLTLFQSPGLATVALLLFIGWSWGVALWWLELESPPQSAFTRVLQTVAAAVLAVWYFCFVWGLIASAFLIVGSAFSG